MHRTQIYLPEALYESLKTRSRSVGVSISELIRRALEKDVQADPVADARAYFLSEWIDRALEKDIQADPVADARAYFERLKPLESFADLDSVDYQRTIRGKSRILRSSDEA